MPVVVIIALPLMACAVVLLASVRGELTDLLVYEEKWSEVGCVVDERPENEKARFEVGDSQCRATHASIAV
jgi:hypothetical protein